MFIITAVVPGNMVQVLILLLLNLRHSSSQKQNKQSPGHVESKKIQERNKVRINSRFIP